MFSHEHKCPREHHNWLVQPFVKDRNRMFHGNRETFFPPERCVFNPPELALRLIRASSKLVKAIASPKARQPAEITGFPPDFNSLGSLNPERTAPDSINPGNLLLENSLLTYRASENDLPSDKEWPESAHANTEDSSKIKDRLEALLSAETLQGTLSPNANPGKGSVGGLLNWMPKATARIQQAAQTLVHLSSVDLLYQSARHCARGE